MVQAFLKFGTDVAGLRAYAAEMIRDYEEDPMGFFSRFRAAAECVRDLVCVFAQEEGSSADLALMKHLEENALGPRFREEMIARSPTSHLFLADHEYVDPFLKALVARIGGD